MKTILAWIANQVPAVRWAELAILLAVVGTIAGLLGVQQYRIGSLRTAVATEKAGRAADRATAATVAASATADRLAESGRRIQANQEIDREATRLETLRQRDADSLAAADVDRRMRNAFRAGVAAGGRAGGGDPGPVSVSAAASAPVDLRADVFDEWDGRARTLEAALDQAHLRGLACEAEYDALRRKASVRLALVGQDAAASAPPSSP
ncbi:MAG TPA: DUF2514 family protein [Burkholderiaceae bacterium]